MIYNAMSINENVEFGARVFSTVVNGVTQFYYTTPFRGTHNSILPLAIPVRGTVASLHTHGAFMERYGAGSNNFSQEDLRWLHGDYLYVATPIGSLLRYTRSTGIIDTVSTLIPSDPNDPRRLNQVSPDGISGPTTNAIRPSWVILSPWIAYFTRW